MATYTPDALVGTIGTMVTTAVGSGVAVAGVAQPSYFGSGRCSQGCAEVSLDKAIWGLTPEDLLSMVNDHEPVGLTYTSASSTTLTVTATGLTDYACLAHSSGASGMLGTLSRTVALSLVSADGRVSIEFDTDLSAIAADEGDRFGFVRFTNEFTDLFRDIPSASFADETGFRGVDLGDATTADLSILIWHDLDADPASVSGSLDVYARYPCNDDPEICEDMDSTVEQAAIAYP